MANPVNYPTKHAVAGLSSPVAAAEKRAILLEIGAVVAFAILSKELLSPFIWRFAGPISLVGVILLITYIGKRRGFSWSDLGLKRLDGWKSRLLVIPQAFLIGVVFAGAVAATFGLAYLLGFDLNETPAGVEDRWGNVQGSLPNYLLWLFVVWTAAAFGEEMLFRGYLITRFQNAFDGSRFGAVLAVLIPALLFGCAHWYYQGFRGMVVTSVIGLVFGTMFLLYKRNLWPLVLWHGLIDTLAFTATYLDWDI